MFVASMALLVAFVAGCGSSSDVSSSGLGERSTISSRPVRVLGDHDKLVDVVAGSPAYRITSPSDRNMTWDLWTHNDDGTTTWVGEIPRFGWFEPVRTKGSVFFVGVLCDTPECELASRAVAVSADVSPTVSELPAKGSTDVEGTVWVKQLPGSTSDLLVWETNESNGAQIVKVDLPRKWEVRFQFPKDMGAMVPCRDEELLFYAVPPDGWFNENDGESSKWEIFEITDTKPRAIGSVEVPTAGMVHCIGSELVVRSNYHNVLGRWNAESGWVSGEERFVPENTQVRWLDNGAIWVDDDGILWMWNGTKHKVGPIPISEAARKTHADSQKRPLGSEPWIMGLIGDIYGNNVIGCAKEAPDSDYSQCVSANN